MKRILPLLLCLLCSPLAGCLTQNQDAIAINGAGVIASVILIRDGNPTAAASAVTISGQLATDIQNFKPGSSTADILQLGNDFLALLRSDTNSQTAEEIATVAGTILNIVSEYDAPNTVGIVAANAVHNAAAGRLQADAANAPRTRAQLYAAYNAALAAHPVAGLKKLK